MPDEEQQKTIFISYSHDSDEHKELVLQLSERLRQDGFKTMLDQYVNGTPLQVWPRWMMDGLDEATYIFVVCTETYYRRFRGQELPDKGKGADWEGMLITQKIYDDKSKQLKYVPIFMRAPDSSFIPDPLRGRTHYTLTSKKEYQSLLDFMDGVAGVEPGPIGTRPKKERRTATALTFDAFPSIRSPRNLPHATLGDLFKGRDEFLEDLATRLNPHGTAEDFNRTKPHVLFGGAGIGKTRATVEYALAQEEPYRALLFVSANTVAELEQNLANLGVV